MIANPLTCPYCGVWLALGVMHLPDCQRPKGTGNLRLSEFVKPTPQAKED